MELIKIKDDRYSDYETLLIRRDSLKADGEQYYLKYLSLFGDLINDVFRMKIECISKKKKIAYCQARVNRNEAINAAELENYIQAVMAEYYMKLDEMISATATAKSAVPISYFESKKIKEIYRELAKMIHPDRRPDLSEDETISELWNQISIAYRCSNLKDLEELKFRTEAYLRTLGDENVEIEIPDLDEKIAQVLKEIDQILTSFPYQYRFIIDDENEIKAKKQELEDELKSYEDYSRQLDQILNQFNLQRIAS